MSDEEKNITNNTTYGNNSPAGNNNNITYNSERQFTENDQTTLLDLLKNQKRGTE